MEFKSDKRALIRTIYLYLFSIIGLVLLTIGSVSMVDLALRVYVFTQADLEQRLWDGPQSKMAMPYPVETLERLDTGKTENVTLSDRDMENIKIWLEDYRKWQEETKDIDTITSRRQGQASKDLAFILIGLPLFLFHWRIIRKETKKEIS